MSAFLKVRVKTTVGSLKLNGHDGAKQQPPVAYAHQKQQPPPPIVTVITKETAKAVKPEKPLQVPQVDAQQQEPEPYLIVLQQLLDARGFNTQAGVEHLSTLISVDSAEFQSLALEIATALGISVDEAVVKLQQWQANQANVRDKMKEQQEEMEAAKAMGREALIPIWCCGVCGRADQPYIACYVAPYIVRYEKRKLK